MIKDFKNKLMIASIASIASIVFIQNFIFSSSFEYLSFRELDDLAFQIVVAKMHEALQHGEFLKFIQNTDYGYGWFYWLIVSLSTFPAYYFNDYIDAQWFIISFPRNISLFFALGAALLLKRISIILGADKTASVVIALLFVLNPIIGYYSMRFGTVTIIIFFSTLSLYFALQDDALSISGLLKAVTALNIAGAIKLSGFLVAPLLVFIFYSRWRSVGRLVGARFGYKAVFGLVAYSVFVFLLCLSPYIFYDLSYLSAVVKNIIYFISSASGSGAIRDPYSVLKNSIFYNYFSAASFALLSLGLAYGTYKRNNNSWLYGGVICYCAIIYIMMSIFSSEWHSFERFVSSISVLLLLGVVALRSSAQHSIIILAICLSTLFDFSLRSYESIRGGGAAQSHFSYYGKLLASAESIELSAKLSNCLKINNFKVDGHILMDHSVFTFINPRAYPNVCVSYLYDNMKNGGLYCDKKVDFIVLDSRRRGFFSNSSFEEAALSLSGFGKLQAEEDRVMRRLLVNSGEFMGGKYRSICVADNMAVFQAAAD
jgi:hypothetical protein